MPVKGKVESCLHSGSPQKCLLLSVYRQVGFAWLHSAMLKCEWKQSFQAFFCKCHALVHRTLQDTYHYKWWQVLQLCSITYMKEAQHDTMYGACCRMLAWKSQATWKMAQVSHSLSSCTSCHVSSQEYGSRARQESSARAATCTCEMPVHHQILSLPFIISRFAETVLCHRSARRLHAALLHAIQQGYTRTMQRLLNSRFPMQCAESRCAACLALKRLQVNSHPVLEISNLWSRSVCNTDCGSRQPSAGLAEECNGLNAHHTVLCVWKGVITSTQPVRSAPDAWETPVLIFNQASSAKLWSKDKGDDIPTDRSVRFRLEVHWSLYIHLTLVMICYRWSATLVSGSSSAFEDRSGSVNRTTLYGTDWTICTIA
jgi:hypothetical protein